MWATGKEPSSQTLTGGDKELDRVSAASDRPDWLGVIAVLEATSPGRKNGREGLPVHMTAFARAHSLRRVRQNERSDRMRLTTPKFVQFI